MKLLVAQFISFAFLVLFLVAHPYRRAFHQHLQLLSLAAPVVALMWSSAGGWEVAAAEGLVTGQGYVVGGLTDEDIAERVLMMLTGKQ